MNRKNTILVAVFINASLLALLFVSALTFKEDVSTSEVIAKEDPFTLPQFDDQLLFNELPNIASEEPVQIKIEEENEPVLVHKLPPLRTELPKEEAKPVEPIVKAILKPQIREISVKKGDSLEKIARLNQTTVDEIVKLNHLSSTFLKIGQVLKLPAKSAVVKNNTVKTNPSIEPQYYTIKVGENPWAIAIRHHMKVDELLKLNGLNEEKARKLKPGDKLRVR